MWINDLGHRLAGYTLTPRRFKRHPLGTMMMFTWAVMGLVILIEPIQDHPWPYLLWPTDLRPGELDDITGYYLIAFSMIFSGAVFLIGHAMTTRTWAAFFRWVSLWMAVGTAFVLFVGILTARYIEYYEMVPYWPFSLWIWAAAIVGFGWALRIVRQERYGHCESVDCDDLPAEGSGG